MGEAAQAIGGDDAMAGDHQRKIIRAAGLAHGARRALQHARDVAIAPGLAAGNRSELLPHAALEGGADLLQRQPETVVGIGDIFFDLRAGALGQRVRGGQGAGAARQIHDLRQRFALGAHPHQPERRVELGLKVWRASVHGCKQMIFI